MYIYICREREIHIHIYMYRTICSKTCGPFFSHQPLSCTVTMLVTTVVNDTGVCKINAHSKTTLSVAQNEHNAYIVIEQINNR